MGRKQSQKPEINKFELSAVRALTNKWQLSKDGGLRSLLAFTSGV